ncbi:MAG: hypothetical protein LBI03_06165 [Clostridiales bacterium]|jgi:hypothetical protein|nr:hypothetical protein [Clostridiales bacterium]
MIRFYSYKNFKRIAILLASGLICWLVITGIITVISNSRTILDIDNNVSIILPAPISLNKEIEAINYNDLSHQGIQIKYPSAFAIKEENFAGSEITYHLDFNGKNDGIYGYFQIWNLKTPFREFLDNSRKASSASISGFTKKKKKINGVNGFRWDYKVNSNNAIIIVRQSFLYNSGKMYVLSFFIPQNKYTEQFNDIFDTMLDSLKIN